MTKHKTKLFKNFANVTKHKTFQEFRHFSLIFPPKLTKFVIITLTPLIVAERKGFPRHVSHPVVVPDLG
jgi:hypothetical protein